MLGISTFGKLWNEDIASIIFLGNKHIGKDRGVPNSNLDIFDSKVLKLLYLSLSYI